jgi:AcrR family transcriptional regulator
MRQAAQPSGSKLATGSSAGPAQAVEAKRAGRPPVLCSSARRACLLEAAAAVFVENGYAAATVEAIAAKAGMSKKTVYRVFGSKLAMFDAVLDDRFFNIDVPPEQDGCSLQQSLAHTLHAVADVLMRPDRLALMRLIIAEGPAAPEVATAFDRIKLGRELNKIENWFERQNELGTLQSADVRESTRLVFGMTIAEPLLQMLVSAPRPPGETPLDQRISEGAHIFLYGQIQRKK